MRHIYLIIFTMWFTTSFAQEEQVCVYEHPNYRGWEQCFIQDQSNFKQLGINDEVSSLRIFGNLQVKLYPHAHYQGKEYLYTENTAWIGDEINDQVSSLQIVSLNQEQVCLYEHPNYQGTERCFTEDQPDFAPLRINDRISSLKVFGHIEVNLFQHARYRGFRRIYTENTPWIGNEADEQFSSLQLIKKMPPKSFRRNLPSRQENPNWIPSPPQRNWDKDDDHGNQKRRNIFRRRNPEQEDNRQPNSHQHPPYDKNPHDQSLEEGYFKFYHNNNQCLATTHFNENGAPLHVWSCQPLPAQLWKWDQGRLINYAGKCLDADSGSMNMNGGRVQLWECHHRANQQWSFNQGHLINQGSGKCLDVYDMDQERNKVQLWDCRPKTSQQWEMIYR